MNQTQLTAAIWRLLRDRGASPGDVLVCCETRVGNRDGLMSEGITTAWNVRIWTRCGVEYFEASTDAELLAKVREVAGKVEVPA